MLLSLMIVRCRPTNHAEVAPVPAPVASVSAAASALPGAYKLRAARGRDVFTSVPAAECALPGAIESRRGRIAEVPVADCALPGVGLSRSTRGRQIVPDVSDAEVLQVPVAALSGEHKLCATRDRKVSVDTDNICAQLSINGITPLTDRKHKCAYCASMGRCKKHCFTKRRRLSKVATKNPPGVSREPADT